MSLSWEKRIGHIDRPIKHRDQRPIASALRKAEHRRRRGLPSRSVPLELIFMGLDVRHAAKFHLWADNEARALKIRYERALVRSRLLERKGAALAKIRVRRIRVADTCINLWRRRKEWLRARGPGPSTQLT